MKTIILISSFFYILGLKISNKIDFVIKSPVEKIITHTLKSNKDAEAYKVDDENKSKVKTDSISGSGTQDKNILNNE